MASSDPSRGMWSEHELRSVKLGDRRLNRRLAVLVESLAARPEARVPQAAGSWAAAKAAYRFWDNDRVSPEAILAAHRDSVCARLPEIGPILAIQDSTALDWTTHPATSGLGYLRTAARSGCCPLGPGRRPRRCPPRPLASACLGERPR